MLRVVHLLHPTAPVVWQSLGHDSPRATPVSTPADWVVWACVAVVTVVTVVVLMGVGAGLEGGRHRGDGPASLGPRAWP